MTGGEGPARGRAAGPRRGSGDRRPTMTDIARLAGVSQSSVSLVLNQMSGARISPETQAKVWEAAHKIGYRLPGLRHLPVKGVLPAEAGAARDAHFDRR